MARNYRRDARGRFSGGGGGSSGGGASAGGGKKPKTPAGRAQANLRAANKELKANPDNKKAAKSALIAQRAQSRIKTNKKIARSIEAKATGKNGQALMAASAKMAAAKPKAEPKAKGGGGSKAAATKAANKANTDRLTAMGQTGIGSRLKKSTEKSYSGTKATKQKNAQLWANAEHNRREDGTGANFSKARAKGTMSRKRK